MLCWGRNCRCESSRVTRDNSQPRFLAQHRVAMLEQYCNPSKQCRNNVATLCCAKNRRCESNSLQPFLKLKSPFLSFSISCAPKRSPYIYLLEVKLKLCLSGRWLVQQTVPLSLWCCGWPCSSGQWRQHCEVRISSCHFMAFLKKNKWHTHNYKWRIKRRKPYG